jgi:hypothetical protein
MIMENISGVSSTVQYSQPQPANTTQAQPAAQPPQNQVQNQAQPTHPPAQAQAPRPTVNTSGQTTGTIVNTTA